MKSLLRKSRPLAASFTNDYSTTFLFREIGSFCRSFAW